MTERDNLITTSQSSARSTAHVLKSPNYLQILLNRGIEGSVPEDIDGENEDVSE